MSHKAPLIESGRPCQKSTLVIHSPFNSQNLSTLALDPISVTGHFVAKPRADWKLRMWKRAASMNPDLWNADYMHE